VLTMVRAYSSWQNADKILLDPAGREETDLFQIQDISGLGPVKAAVNTSPLGSLDGDVYVGSSVSFRNIVLSIKPNPDWDTWSFEALRRLLYEYFTPKQQIRLVFETDEISPVEIFGYVEHIEPMIFSKSGEVQISIICPYPYFTAIDPVVITGISTDAPHVIDYNESIESGILVQVTYTSGASPTVIGIQLGDPTVTYFRVNGSVDANKYFLMSSVPGKKYVQNVSIASSPSAPGVITNLLSKIQAGSQWPTLKLGNNNFSIVTNAGVQDWKLTYYPRYGGL
jgi:Phage tail protein